MNWENYDKLMNHMKSMPKENFAYGVGFYLPPDDLMKFNPSNKGCIACQILTIESCKIPTSTNGKVISDYLGIPLNEGEYLWCPSSYGRNYGIKEPDNFREFDSHSSSLFSRSGGLLELAIKKLEFIASRYVRPYEKETNEERFIKSIRELANNPGEIYAE